MMELIVVDEGEGDETDSDGGEHDGDRPRKEGIVHGYNGVEGLEILDTGIREKGCEVYGSICRGMREWR